MSKVKFNIFTAEEFDNDVVEGTGEVKEESVVDQIETENDAVEINNEISTFEEHCENCSDAVDAVTELQEQVNEQEEKIENAPEEVTEEVVEVAQEQFYITMSKISHLGYYGEGKISHELSAGTPLEKLKISCEGVGDFIKKVIEKIKSFFVSIKNWFVKILQKLGIMSKATNESIKKDLEAIKVMPDSTPEEIETALTTLAEEEGVSEVVTSSKDVKSNVPATLTDIIGWYGTLFAKTSKDLIDFFYSTKGTNTLEKIFIKQIEPATKSYEELITDMMAKGEKFTEADLNKRVDEIKNAAIRNNESKGILNSAKRLHLKNVSVYITMITSTELKFAGIAEDQLKGGSIVYNTTSSSFKDGGEPVIRKEISKFMEYVDKNEEKLQAVADKNTAEYNKIFGSSKSTVQKYIDSYEQKIKDYDGYISKTNTTLAEDLQTKNAVTVAMSASKLLSEFMNGYLKTGGTYLSASRRIISYTKKVKATIAKAKQK